MLGEKWVAAIAACLIGAGMILILTKSLDSSYENNPKNRILYLLAAGWLILFSVFLTSLLAAALETVL